MTRNRHLLSLVSRLWRGSPSVACLLSLVFLAGCAGNLKVKIDPTNPVYVPKNDFERDYGFLITTDEKKKGYTLEDYPELSEPIKPFDQIDTLGEFRRFEYHFWHIRDTDPNTPENERKELIDSRIRDIQNEIFAADTDIPQTLFSRNGGLRGDMAHVYLLHGAPNYKDKMSGDTTHVDLMVWYYMDVNDGTLMAFLFYEKFDRFKIFMNQEGAALDIQLVLKEISRSGAFTSDEDYQRLWEKLLSKDPERAFVRAMFSFSDYTHLDKDTRWTVDKALEAPEPAALTAKRFKPVILGQPDIPEGIELFESGYHSFLPSYLRTSAGPDNPTFLMLTILRKNLDWVKQENEAKPYATNLNIRISFQNKKTRKLTEFVSYFKFELSQAEFDRRDDKGELFGVSVIFPAALQYFDGEKLGPTLGETLKQLEPGEYVVNIYLQHTITKKYNTWREGIIISH